MKNLHLSRTYSTFSVLTLYPQKPLNDSMPAFISSMLWVSESMSRPIFKTHFAQGKKHLHSQVITHPSALPSDLTTP